MEWDGDDALRPAHEQGPPASRERLGRFLGERGIRPDVIVSSPKVRALQTAEIVAAELGMTVRLDDRLAGASASASSGRLLDELGAREPMLVGHDPDFSSLLLYLIDGAGISPAQGRPSPPSTWPPSSVTARAALRWLVPPDLLER